ncbi:MAG: hypothetical protein PWR03_1780 [Tenuifilum sp.]|uniref:hypothetical protein n=1 Tax=Tenuifilum sp. TaxID=2760880 RepID=UPI0024AB4AFF|nr:hypothetical protein [Tenuifilum sp.]MDI3527597.1 hypothetical protein [Tenuifilum sp.]
MEKQETFQIVEKCVRNKFEYLIQKGYTLSCVDYKYDIRTSRPEGEKRNEDLLIIYKNESIDRLVEILYMFENAYFEPYNFISIRIGKNDDSLYLDEYLLKIEKKRLGLNNPEESLKLKKEVINKKFLLDYYEGESMEEKVNKFLDFVIGLFKADLKGVIEGKKWIHIPFDWYKIK